MSSVSSTNSKPDKVDKLTRRRRLIRSFEKKALGHRTWPEKIADVITENTGSITFLLINCYWFAAWIVLNSDIVPGIHPFDPFPFGLLTMIVSLEAIVLAIFVLISQNRAAKISALRDELQLQVNLIAEEEITKVLELLSDIRTKVGVRKEDPELEKMLERIDTSYIEQSLQKQMENSNIDYIHIANPINVLPGVKDIEKNAPSKKNGVKK
jgi:uncharacterized membrane protein